MKVRSPLLRRNLPLASSFVARAERDLGVGLSGVRAHESLLVPFFGATALTIGRDLYFAPGKLRLDHEEGRRLAGHELAHVAQQGKGRVGASGRVGGLLVNDNPRLEAEAEGAGRRIAAGGETRLVPAFRTQGAGSPVASRVAQMQADPAEAERLIERMATKATRYVQDNRGIYNGLFAQPVATAHNGLAAVKAALAPATDLGVDVQDLAAGNAVAAGTPQIDSDLWLGKMQQANEGIFGNLREFEVVSRELEQSHSTQLGATAAGVGGDYSVFENQGGVFPADRRAGKTVQSKYVSSATFGVVTDNLKEAADQLAGTHGETPPADHQRVVELTIGNPDNYWPLANLAARANTTAAQFKAKAQEVLSGNTAPLWAQKRKNADRVELRWDPDVFGPNGVALGGGVAAASQVASLAFRRKVSDPNKNTFLPWP
jgi:hypothetical protein